MIRRYDESKVEAWVSLAKKLLVSGSKRLKEGGTVLLKRTHPELGNYVINASQDVFHGWALLETGEIIPGYPHLANYNTNLFQKVPKTASFYGEIKLNGTNIRWTVTENGDEIVSTRGGINPSKFMVQSLFAEERRRLRDRKLASILDERVRKLMEAGYDFVEIVGEGEQIYIKLPEAFYAAKKISGDFSVPESVLKKYVLFFELYGWVNTILIAENTRGLYPVDFKKPLQVALFDVFDKEKMRFLSRKEKEELAEKYGIPVVPLSFMSPLEQLVSRVDQFRRLADESGEEGFVVKSDEAYMMFKLKTEDVLEFARRGWAVAKGLILFSDMATAVSRALTAVNFDPSAFDEAVSVAVEELRADYPEDIVKKNFKKIRFEVLKTLCSFYALKVAEEMLKRGAELEEVYRALNTKLPELVPPAAKYIKIEEEKKLKAAGKTDEARRLKEMRKRLVNPAIRYINKKLREKASRKSFLVVSFCCF